ncbi:MAG: ubiquinone biosynthesis monooxygenase Coq7 [Gammaproteobacteria bacterium]|jgi:ubiquinone biosynthesis monooxygenase Coq7
MSQRQYTQLDRFIIDFDVALASRFAKTAGSKRKNPARDDPKPTLAVNEKRVSQGLMRVNHAGEVSAQALYHGQSLTARSSSVQKSMQRAAEEEVDHLNWCKERLDELETHTSYLNPLWYFGSFSIGALAGVLGDKWSLGFVAETEHQVVEHLRSHLRKLPSKDDKSRAILEQMKTDEAQHASMALESGAEELPVKIKKLMKLCSLVMTTTAYWV